MWKAVGPELGDQALDPCMPKLRGEVGVSGRAYPAQPPKPSAVVRLTLGAIDKTLYVVGDRAWNRGAPTDPAPFDEMPLTYARAYGGDGYGLIRAVRKLTAERGGRTPAIALTAHARESDGERAFAAGFQRYASKPLDLDRLVSMVANLGGISFGDPSATIDH